MQRDRAQWTSPLISDGWSLDHACVCGGVYREDWTNPNAKGYEISIYPDGNKIMGPRFVIKFYNLVKAKFPLSQLAHQLTTYEFKRTKSA